MEDKKIDTTEMQIASSKILANGEAYFKLFEKHVPRDLGAGADVMLYKIGNMTCMLELIALNPAASYVIVGNEAASNALKVMLPEATKVKYLREFDFKETDMKFDCIVMNPPYQHGLCDKILKEALNHLKDDGIVISLQPIKPWQKADLLGNPFPIAGSFVSEIIRGHEANVLFDIATQDLGIITNKESIGKVVLTENRELLDKIIQKLSSLPSIYLRKSKEYKPWSLNIAENSCRMNTAAPGKITEGCYQIVATKREVAFENKKLGPSSVYVECVGKEEREFAWNFYRSTFMRFVYKSLGFGYAPGKFIPDWRAIETNYSKLWDDARFYEYFDISDEEQKIIEKSLL